MSRQKTKSECGGQCEYSYVSGTCYTSAKALADIARLVEAHVRDPKKSTQPLQASSELVTKYTKPRAILIDVANTYGFNQVSTLFLEELAKDDNGIRDESFYALLRFIGQNYKAMQNKFPSEGIKAGMENSPLMAPQVLYFDELKKNLTTWNNKQIIAAALGVLAVGSILVMAGKSVKDSPAFADLTAYVYSKEGFKSVANERDELRNVVARNKQEFNMLIGLLEKNKQQLNQQSDSIIRERFNRDVLPHMFSVPAVAAMIGYGDMSYQYNRYLKLKIQKNMNEKTISSCRETYREHLKDDQAAKTHLRTFGNSAASTVGNEKRTDFLKCWKLIFHPEATKAGRYDWLFENSVFEKYFAKFLNTKMPDPTVEFGLRQDAEDPLSVS